MDDEYPHQGPGEENQDIYPERTGLRAPVTADSQPPAAPVPGIPAPTGDDRVDAAMAELSRLPGTPPAEHVAVLEEVHGRLRDILGELGDDDGEPGRAQRRP
jgi:hypothetical protein